MSEPINSADLRKWAGELRMRQSQIDHNPRRRDAMGVEGGWIDAEDAELDAGYESHHLPSPHNQTNGAFLRLLAERAAPLNQNGRPIDLSGVILNDEDVGRLRTIAQRLDGVRPDQLEEYQLWRDNASGRIASIVFADDKRVVYLNGTDKAHMLGLRRFLRDFTHVPDRTGPAQPQPEGRA